MQRFFFPSLLAVLLIGLLQAQDPTANDAKAIQGDWLPAEFESGDLKIPAAPEMKTVMRITSDKIEVMGDKKSAGYRLGKEKDLGTIDVMPESDKDKPIKGLYKLEGDTLKICFTSADTATRPKEFNARPPQGILTLKREKEKEKEKKDGK